MSSEASRPMRQQVEDYVRTLQDQIVTSLEQLDPNAPAFKRDTWERPEGGAGQSCIFTMPTVSGDELHQSILEKAGVNISIVNGTLPPPAVKQMLADHSSMPLPKDVPGGLPFFAAGLSLVIHPRNPMAPTAHANFRYFEITESANSAGDSKILAWWFGGGADLTPAYLFEEDAVHFHKTLKDAADPFGTQIYPTFKKWCDEYFYIPHRQETRGVGGIFFDDLNENPHPRLSEPSDGTTHSSATPGSTVTVARERPKTKQELFSLVQALGNAFVPSYIPILEKRCRMEYTPHHRRWQLIRRGRYVEFNLVYDRGTKFGLMTPGARVESILMSLPEVARWEYMTEMGQDEQSDEGKLMEVLKNPRDWV